MPVREQVPMDRTEFQAYARRRKVKKEDPDGHPATGRDQLAECRGSGNLHSDADFDPAGRLLSLELDVAQALVEFSRVAHLPSQRHKALRWTCKRKRTSSSAGKDLAVRPPQHNEDLEDALSAIKRNRSACACGRDSSTSDRDEIESARCSKESSSIFESRAQSPSSPLPSAQLPSRTFGACGGMSVKSAFQRVLPVAPCLVTVKTEVEDIQFDRLPERHPKVSVRPKWKARKSMGLKASVKTEVALDHNSRCSEQQGVKVMTAEAKGAGALLSNKAKCAMSEEEKEARRLRRIQANRESARQTILKKQVLCEDLTKKASSLALENETLRQKRESLMQELFCLKGQNNHLKQQLEIRSSGNVGHDAMASPSKHASDAASRPSSQPANLAYTGLPPPALFWAMAAAAAAAAAAANKAYTFNSQEMWDASSTRQLQNNALAVSGNLPAFNQPPMPGSVKQNLSRASSGDSSLTGTDLSQKEGDLIMNTCARSPAIEAQCDDSSLNATHSSAEYATGDSSGKVASEMSMQVTGMLPQPSAATRPTLNSVPGIVATTKEFGKGRHIVQGSAASFNYGHSGAGFSKGNPQVHAMKGYAAMVAAEARRRRKELTRHKFARARSLKPAAVS